MFDELEVERTLLQVLREYLEDDEIGLEDNFYVRGGDSIVALRVVAAAKDRGLEIDLPDLLLQPTVGDLARVVAGGAEDQETSGPGIGSALWHEAAQPALWPEAGQREADHPGRPDGVADMFPAASLQTGLIYMCEMADDPGLYHEFIGMRVTTRFVEPLFRAALQAVIRRHPMLRSSFDLASFDSAVQLIWPGIEDPLTVESVATEQDAAERASRWVAGRLSEGIDWSSPPLFRCHAAVAPGSFRLTIGIHHAIIDGWSYARLIIDLLTCYDAGLHGEAAARLAPVPADGHRQFLALEQAALNSPDSAGFWREEAGPAPLLFQRERFESLADPTATRALPIGDDLEARLRRAAASAGVPLKSLLLAVHGWALGHWTGRDRDVVTGMVVNGRPEISGSDLLVGLFLNTVPVRLHSVTGPFGELARQALAAEQRVMPHRRYPLARIEDELGRPAFDVSFNFTNFHVYRELAGLRRVGADQWWAQDKVSFPLVVDFMIDGRGFGTGMLVSFDETMLDAGRADTLVALFGEGLDLAARG